MSAKSPTPPSPTTPTGAPPWAPAGDRLTLLQAISAAGSAPLPLYLAAMEQLIAWQLRTAPEGLAACDAAGLQAEMEGFVQHYVVARRGIVPDTAQRTMLSQTFATIAAQCLTWPLVVSHGDFSPSQLDVSGESIEAASNARAVVIHPPNHAMLRPITYDITSLVRDTSVVWEEDFDLDVCVRYWERARRAGLAVGDDFGEFYRACEWMGLQRQLGQVGLRAARAGVTAAGDNDPTPSLLHLMAYARATCARYRELKPLLRFIEMVEGIAAPVGYAFGRM